MTALNWGGPQPQQPGPVSKPRAFPSTLPVRMSYLALLAMLMDRFDEAEARFAAAEAAHERIGAPTWLARTRLEWARMLINRGRPGDAEQARELLRQAVATARELRLANIERRAVELLA